MESPETPEDVIGYRRFFELSDSMMVVIDVESHCILEANQKAVEFYGWSREELRQIRIDQINVLPEAEVSQIVAQAHNPGAHRFQFRHRLRHGEIRDVEVHITPGPWAGRPANYAIIHDVTEIRRMERQNLQTERLRAVGELTASLYHEFGNILGILFSQIQLMELDTPEGPRKQQRHASFESQFLRARKLVESVKRFSRDEGIELQDCRVSPLLEDLVELERPLCRRRGITVTLGLAEDDWVRIDPALVQQVFLNLFKNALEALESTPSPRLAIDVGVDAGFVVVRVADNGPGIPEAVRARLFTPFFTTKGSSGTGLGLSFSAHIIHNHGGALFLEEGPGATFQVRLPLAAPKP